MIEKNKLVEKRLKGNAGNFYVLQKNELMVLSYLGFLVNFSKNRFWKGIFMNGSKNNKSTASLEKTRQKEDKRRWKILSVCKIFD